MGKEELENKLARVRDGLNKVSPSFCLAKWLQVTLHLQNGFNHSCHHPNVHQTPLDILAKDPSALHNTPFKKEQRRLMLEGKRPAECEYCWKVEDTVGSHHSDRILKSADTWALPHFDRIANLDPSVSVNPTYMEVSFGNECNFRCAYCAPQISSSLWSSYEKYGAFVGRSSLEEVRAQGLAPIRGSENPYVKAFWEWFPSLAPDLKVFRITGGEPLINQNTFRVLDFIEAHPLPNLQLCINSNFGVPESYFRKFIDKLKALTDARKIGDFMMYTSVDTHGEQAEYIRTGLNYSLWQSRVRTYLKELPWNLTFMVTFNALSVPRFQYLLQDLLELNRETMGKKEGVDIKRTILDLSHLMHPEYFSAWTLSGPWIGEIGKLTEFMERNSAYQVGPSGFFEYEIHKMRRIATWAESTSREPPYDISYFRALFYLFTKQYEEREGKKFLEVFPELTDHLAVSQTALTGQNDYFWARYSPATPKG